MHNIKANFDKIIDIVHPFLQDLVDKEGNFHKVGRKPKFSDLSIICLSLTAEALGIDSENHLFYKLNKEYKEDFPLLVHRTQYNIRRRKLSHYTELLRTRLAQHIDVDENVFSIDSMPIEVCKLSRMQRNRLGKDHFEHAPDKGFCASQNQYFYGYKLHCVCSYRGIIHSYDITKASVHDIHYLQTVKHQFKNCLILGDKGYINVNIRLDLFHTANIELQVPKRSNQKDYQKQPYIFRKTRKRIETLFSQMCDQFMIRRNYAKSISGFNSRLIAKLSALTCLQFLNFLNLKPLGNIKHAFN